MLLQLAAAAGQVSLDKGGGVSCQENEETVSATASYDLLGAPTISLVTYVESLLNVTKIFVNYRHVGRETEGIV